VRSAVVPERQAHANQSADPVGPGTDRERAPDGLGALCARGQPDVPRPRRQRRPLEIDPYAVVADRQLDGVRPLANGDPQLRGAGVLGHVGDQLARDREDQLIIAPTVVFVGVDVDVEAGVTARALGYRAQRDAQAGLLEEVRVQIEHRLPQLHHRLVETLCDDFKLGAVAGAEPTGDEPIIQEQLEPDAPRRQLFGLPGRQLLLALGLVMTVWLAGLVGALIGVQWAQQRSAPLRKPSTLGVQVVEPRENAMPRLDIEAIANDVAPSVVAVQSSLVRAGQLGESIGTGLIVTADGEVITNAHVVGDATTVNVRLNGESEPREAAVIASDPSRDLALLRVDVDGLSAATFAARGDVRLGDEVLAIGYALDLDGDPTVTLGIVSSLDRTLATDDGPLKGLIQTDAAVSSGNSGGPLINAVGRVVGINTLASSAGVGSTANGLGFAISVEELLPTLEQLREQATGQTLVSGYLGVQLESRRDGGSGALVANVFSGLAAAKAGIKVGDVVVAVDGLPISGQAGLGATIRNLVPGEEAVVSLVRGGKPLDVSVVVGERPPES